MKRRVSKERQALIALVDALWELLGHFDTGAADMRRVREQLIKALATLRGKT